MNMYVAERLKISDLESNSVNKPAEMVADKVFHSRESLGKLIDVFNYPYRYER